MSKIVYVCVAQLHVCPCISIDSSIVCGGFKFGCFAVSQWTLIRISLSLSFVIQTEKKQREKHLFFYRNE